MSPAATESAAATDPPPNVELAGVSLDAITADQTIRRIFDGVADGRGGWLITYNLDILRRSCTDPVFATRSRRATLRVADGIPLLWAARVQGTPLPGRVAGSDLIFDVAATAAAEDRSVFLLGGHPPEVCDEAARRLEQAYPGLRVVGTDAPPMGFLDDPAEVGRIRDLLVAARPDVVLIGLPPALQAAVHDRFADDLGDPTWWLGVGVSFSFVTGDVERAPIWMQRVGLEWVHRLLKEPRRLARRYLVEGIPFGCRLLAGAAVTRVRAARRAPA